MARLLITGMLILAAVDTAYAQCDGNTPSACRSPLFGNYAHEDIWFDYLPAVEDLDSSFPLNMALFYGLTGAAMPPRSHDPVKGSLPLVSGEAGHFRGPNPKAERLTIAGVLDPVTGSPLYQQTDFELSFGSATFRHLRTYAEPATRMSFGIPETFPSAYPNYLAAWDWNGQHWMMGESPILLVDAKFANVDTASRYAYLIPDSHHTIPFRKDQTDPHVYEAPKWFDAVLTTDGQSPPQKYYVSLARQSITYTFVAHYEDHWQFQRDCDSELCDPVDCNGQPGNTPCTIPEAQEAPGGRGTPHYALLEKIEDRYGNRVSISYVDQVIEDCNRAPSCCQNCNEKGQIASVKLYPAGSATAAWTLVYTHRPFSAPYRETDGDHPWPANVDARLWHLWYPHALHSIHVYREDLSLSALGAATLDYSHFYGTHTEGTLNDSDYFDVQSAPVLSFDEYDAVDAEGIRGLPIDWVYRAQYTYKEPAQEWYYDAPTSTQYKTYGGRLDNEFHSDRIDLIKSSVTQRSDAGSVVTTDTMYRYRLHQGVHQLYRAADLYAVYGQAAITSIVRGLSGDPNQTVNDVLTFDDATTVTIADGGTSLTKNLAQCADLYFGYYTDVEQASDQASEYDLAVAIGVTFPCASDHKGRSKLIDRRDGTHVYRIRKFETFAPVSDPNYQTYLEYGVYWNWSDVAQYQYPYPWPWDPYGSGDPLEDWSRAAYVVVIDEADPNALPDLSDPNIVVPSIVLDAGRLISRRVIGFSPAGLRIFERHYAFDGEGATLTMAEGFSQREFRNEDGHVIAVGSVGWGSSDNVSTTESDGLVIRYRYYDTSGLEGELRAVGVQRGFDPNDPNGTPVYWREIYERSAERPELVTKRTQFANAVTDIDADGNDIIGDVIDRTVFMLDPNREMAVTSKSVIRSRAPRNTSSGIEYYYGVTRETYDVAGNISWQASGSISDPANLATALEWFVDQHIRDDETGELLEYVKDSAAGTGELARITPEPTLVAPLAWSTRYEYDETLGLRKITYPNGRQTFMVFRADPNDTSIMEHWLYKDVVPIGDPNSATSAELKSPIRVTRYSFSGSILGSFEIAKPVISYPPEGETAYASQVVSESTTTLESGRITGLSRTGADGTNVSASVSYHPTGQIEKSVSPDGSIVRNVFDTLGRVTAVYHGTADAHPHWGTADPGDAETWNDNLVLTEKRYYGAGVTNANQITAIRSYHEKPENQYEYVDANVVYSSNEDSLGWRSEIDYDWRMRPVWVRELDANDTLIRNTVTWYDHQDRPRLVATYGVASPSGAIDPRDFSPGQAVPTPAAVLAASVPLSLTESLYNGRGLLQEWRAYHVDANSVSADDYLSTMTYYDHADRVVETHPPSGPSIHNLYDAEGRQVVSRRVANGVTISQSHTRYDKNSRAYATEYWERNHDSSATDYDADEGVTSYTHSWYDEAGRLLASVNYGTNAGTYSSGTAPSYDANAVPASYDPNGRLTDCAAPTVDAMCTCYGYDSAGRTSDIIHPDGTRTRYEFDGLGREILMTENADGATPRHTAYTYDNKGRLITIAAVMQTIDDYDDINWAATDASLQVTELVYGADVVDRSGAPISQNNAWIASVRYPKPDTGQSTTVPDITLTYYSDGAVASRTDTRGVTMTYTYDSLGRQVETVVDDSSVFGSLDPNKTPADRVTRVEYDYLADGKPTSVTAYTVDPNARERVLAHNQYGYDQADNLLFEKQQHFGVVDANSPQVSYTWTFANAMSGNFNRPTTMTYPYRPSGQATRTLTFHYGNNTSDLDHALNRLTGIYDSGLGVDVVEYVYSGMGRRVETTFGNGVTQTFVGGSGYSGLDRFGRTRDLHFKLSSTTLHRSEYAYDLMGNREDVRVTQRPFGGEDNDNDRSFDYSYNALQQLVASDMGKLDTTTGAIIDDASIPFRRENVWGMDVLGNWNKEGMARRDDLNADGTFETLIAEQLQSTDARNQLISTQEGNDVTPILFDLGGNLVFDGDYWFQYDGFGRLIQVNYAGSLTDSDFNTSGVRVSGTPGCLIAAYVYDGHGRLIAKRNPYDTGVMPACLIDLLTDHYYDGVRRIQTITYTPPESCESQAVYQEFRERDYVYGPGDVDEHVVEIGDNAKPMYTLQDDNLNVVAKVDKNGAVVEQYSYEPYGEPVASEKLVNHPHTWNGHQGLFFERLQLMSTHRTLEAGAPGLYYNRNRWHWPKYGRFLTRDPVETAMPLMIAKTRNGQSIQILAAGFSAVGHYGDGLNLYGYLGANPINRRDALGLYVDPFEEIDDIINQMQSERVEAVGRAAFGMQALAKMAVTAAVTTLIVATIPGAGLYFAIQGVGDSIEFIQEYGWTWNTAAFLALNVTGVGGAVAHTARQGVQVANALSRLGARFNSHLTRTRAAYGATARFSKVSNRIPCASFAAGTPVETPAGPIPIEQLRPGDEILTRSDNDGATLAPEPGYVKRIFKRIAPAVIWLTLLDGTTIGVTPEHEVYTEAQGWRYVSELETNSSLVDARGVALTIVAIEVDPTPRPVYNLETSCGTYFAQGVWAHNSPCPADLIGKARGYHSGMGDPADWTFLRVKDGSGKRGHVTPENRKIYEVWEDAWGTQREVHYFERPDGSIYNVEIK